MTPHRTTFALMLGLALLPWSAAQIGLPLMEAVAAAALEVTSEADEAPLRARTAGGTEVTLAVRGDALWRVGGDGSFDDATIADVARVIGVATGFFAAIAEPVEGYLRQNLAALAGAGPFEVQVEAYRLVLDVRGDAPPYEVSWMIALAEVPEEAFPAARHAKGPADARYVIREFSDLQCPACASYASRVVPALEATLLVRGDVRFEYHHFVLGGRFANSGLAAEASECVAEANPEEPDAFWRYVDALFERQPAWSAMADATGFFVALVQESGLAGEGVDECVAEGTHRAHVRAATEHAASLGVAATPTVFVGPFQVRDFGRLEAYLEAMARIDAFRLAEAE